MGGICVIRDLCPLITICSRLAWIFNMTERFQDVFQFSLHLELLNRDQLADDGSPVAKKIKPVNLQISFDFWIADIGIFKNLFWYEQQPMFESWDIWRWIWPLKRVKYRNFIWWCESISCCNFKDVTDTVFNGRLSPMLVPSCIGHPVYNSTRIYHVHVKIMSINKTDGFSFSNKTSLSDWIASFRKS